MNTRSRNKVSMIIPIYNEATVINKLLINLDQFKDYCEIIFVDGGSSDGTDRIIKKKYDLVYSPKKGRANQMNYGAKLSKGNILLFIHGDSILPRDALTEVHRIIDKGYKVGAFKLKFDSNNVLMKICGFMSNLRILLRNIAFGDQGIFIRKDYFEKIGGFLDIPIMEDYQLSMDIKTDGEKIALTKTKITTSERRFLDNGRLRTMARMQKLQYMYRKGEDIEKIANLYR
ncbi:MAG TPA: TIGR04283 family arsenosugar biosynthesis glycosyltransferase [Tissierellaceae bacterium]|nr:TIGR04283 family arsenosugar biosynthesis glycosyltransferase [Tissierellaceae bacterium]